MRSSSALIRLFKRDLDWKETWGRVMIRCGSKFDGETLVVEPTQGWEMPASTWERCQAWADVAGLPIVCGQAHQNHDEVGALAQALVRRTSVSHAVESISRSAAHRAPTLPQGPLGPVCPACLEAGKGEHALEPSWTFVDVPIQELHVRPETRRHRWGIDVAYRTLDLTSGALVAGCPCCGAEFWVEVERFASSSAPEEVV